MFTFVGVQIGLVCAAPLFTIHLFLLNCQLIHLVISSKTCTVGYYRYMTNVNTHTQPLIFMSKCAGCEATLPSDTRLISSFCLLFPVIDPWLSPAPHGYCCYSCQALHLACQAIVFSSISVRYSTSYNLKFLVEYLKNDRRQDDCTHMSYIQDIINQQSNGDESHLFKTDGKVYCVNPMQA